jgi:hypothetical protein
MISFIRRARKHVCDTAADDRSDDAEHDRPGKRYVHVHHRFRDDARDKPNQYIPDQVKHTFSPSFGFRTSLSSHKLRLKKKEGCPLLDTTLRLRRVSVLNRRCGPIRKWWLIVIWMTVAPVPIIMLIRMFPMLVGKISLVALVLVGPVCAVLAVVPVVIVVVPWVVDTDLHMFIVGRCSSDRGAACRKGRRQEKCCYV